MSQAMEKYEHKEKISRIAEYLDTPYGVEDIGELEKNPFLLYGKFDPINSDNFGLLCLKGLSGEKLKFHDKAIRCFERAKTFDENKLKITIGKIKPAYSKNSIERLYFYTLNIKLSELGIAPRWRMINKPHQRPKNSPWTVEEIQYNRDMQVFDMEWIHRQYKNHKAVTRFEGLFEKLLTDDQFDYGLAHIIAAAELTASEKAKLFRLRDHMKAEMMVFRDKSIERKHQKLMDNLDEVESDLRSAAHHNRRRGDKLLSNLSDWLNVWLSAAMTIGKSESLRIENYKRVTGNDINRSTFRSKLKAINEALREVGSRHVLSDAK